MQLKIKSEYVSWAILLGLVVLLLEISFFNRGVIFSLLVAIGMIYMGRKWMPSSTGKLFFWFGIIFFTLSIFNMMTFKFLLLAILVFLIMEYAKSKKKPEVIQPIIKTEDLEKKQAEVLLEKKPIFENTLFKDRKTPEQVYEWNDINIQTLIGDTTVDLSYTVLPKGETVIFIRSFVGNLQVLVPYDIEVSINHSSIVGTANVFHFEGDKMFNQSVQYQTEGYEKAEQKVKIFTSFFAGDLEVKRS
ncbi:cell wall-active antibiotics response protein LiaF [Robertmurraya andreesenii]|uniref:Lia operon protein LiaF n=1 Tax=Anoxybacillus andreesenii TaxID=1325932 RepID=A0ABT9V3L2_9BACL|nr:cell wall-active antibiotics response protein LiaF [Robertmurraya andreesenii]MDQ0155538.1 lia operon protein LiaF [Robertmurraya andreesenii]